MHDDESLSCHRCGSALTRGEASFYVVRLEAFADPSPPSEKVMEEIEAEGFAAGCERLLEALRERSEQELMDEVYRRLTLLLCVPCYQEWIDNPTG